jgi:hypothetical protein
MEKWPAKPSAGDFARGRSPGAPTASMASGKTRRREVFMVVSATPKSSGDGAADVSVWLGFAGKPCMIHPSGGPSTIPN